MTRQAKRNPGLEDILQFGSRLIERVGVTPDTGEFRNLAVSGAGIRELITCRVSRGGLDVIL